MATEAEIEAAARERYIRTHVRTGFTREKANQWWMQYSRAPGSWILQELDDAGAALDAAASVRAETGTAGMEIIRLVAAIPLHQDERPTSPIIDFEFSSMRAAGLTPDHVRAARAIVAQADRKEVMPPEPALSTGHNRSEIAPPPAGPSPAEGAPRRTFVDPGMQADYVALRTNPPAVEDHPKIRSAGGRLNAYVVGYEQPDEPCRLWPRNSRGYAAWAAGVDNRRAVPQPPPPAAMPDAPPSVDRLLDMLDAHSNTKWWGKDLMIWTATLIRSQVDALTRLRNERVTPPAAPDVVELIKRLDTDWRYSTDVAHIDKSVLKRACDALSAQAAEIERFKAAGSSDIVGVIEQIDFHARNDILHGGFWRDAANKIRAQAAALAAKDAEIERWTAKEADAYERAHSTLCDEIATKDERIAALESEIVALKGLADRPK